MKLLITILSVLFLACSAEHKPATITQNTGSLDSSFPRMKYDKIKLLSLDSSVRYFYPPDSFNRYLPILLNQGLAFIDKQGKLTHRRIKQIELDSRDQQILINTLRPSYANPDGETTTTCEGFYRDVIGFYIKDKLVASVYLCFDCSIAEFNPSAIYMEGFNRDYFWGDLKTLFKKHGIDVTYQKSKGF